MRVLLPPAAADLTELFACFDAACDDMERLLGVIGLARTDSPSGYDERTMTTLLAQSIARRHPHDWHVVPEMNTRNAESRAAKLDLLICSPHLLVLLEAKRFYGRNVRGQAVDQNEAIMQDIERWKQRDRWNDLVSGRIDIADRVAMVACMTDCWGGYTTKGRRLIPAEATHPDYLQDHDALVRLFSAPEWRRHPDRPRDLSHRAVNGRHRWGYWWWLTTMELAP